MDRKFKVMGFYIGIMFFVVILLILVTSFSNTELDPSYDVENEKSEYQVTFNRTMEQSVNSLTESNEKLNDRVKELTEQIEEKNKIIADYESKNNESIRNLQEAIKLYIMDDDESAREKLSQVNPEEIGEENLDVYNQLSQKLN